MPTYEVEMNGKSYEVDAPSIEAFTKAYQGQGEAAQGDFLHPVKPAAGSGWRGVGERLLQYPGMFLGQINDAGETLGKVSRGEVDAATPEAAGAAATIGSLLGPTTIARTGAARPLAPGMEAAQTAVDLGSPLPAGIVSQTPGVQAATQGSRRLPLVGQNIEERVGNTVKAAGNRVNELAEEYGGGGVLDRPTAAANTRSALEGVIESNNQSIDALYDDLRNNHIKSNLFSSPANTKKALQDIGSKRWTAGEDRTSGLADIERLISSGKPFDGLVRARSRVGKDIGANERNPNPGFPTGDMKYLYGAISRDMENAVTAPANLRPGVNPADAMASFRTANDTAREIIGRNANIQRILNIKNDEGMFGGIQNMTKNKTGNARVLGELRSQLPEEDFNTIRSAYIHELGYKPSIPGEFSLNQLASRWKDTNPSIKSIMIADPAHRKALDDIAGLGDFLKDADKYVNHSATSGGNAVAALIGAVAGGHIKEALAGLVGGYTFGKVLARPASASALRKWLTIARDKETGRYGPAQAASVNARLAIAGRNLLNNLPEPAQADQAQSASVPLPRSDPRLKNQSRAPAGAAF